MEQRKRPLSSLTRAEIKARLAEKKQAKQIKQTTTEDKKTLAGLLQILIYIIIGLIIFGFGGLAALRSYFHL